MNTASGSSGSVSAKPTWIWSRRQKQLIVTKQVLPGMHDALQLPWCLSRWHETHSQNPTGNAFVLLSGVGTELNHPVGYRHRPPAGLSETKHEAWEPHDSHHCAECNKCSVSHGATHPLLTWPAPAREVPQTAGHNELNHAPTKKTTVPFSPTPEDQGVRSSRRKGYYNPKRVGRMQHFCLAIYSIDTQQLIQP